jgi:hypothetical protein
MKENRPPFLFDDKLKASIKKVKKIIEKEEKKLAEYEKLKASDLFY